MAPLKLLTISTHGKTINTHGKTIGTHGKTIGTHVTAKLLTLMAPLKA